MAIWSDSTPTRVEFTWSRGQQGRACTDARERDAREQVVAFRENFLRTRVFHIGIKETFFPVL